MLSPKTYCNPNNFLFRENNSDITIEAHRFLNGEGDNSGCPHGRFRASVRYDKNTVRGRAFDWVSQSQSQRNRNGQSERKKISMSQWELKFRTSQLSEPRENTVGQIAFGFSFEWDWFGMWCEFSVPIIETQTIPDDFRHSIENCSVILHQRWCNWSYVEKTRNFIRTPSRVNICGVQHECVCRTQC